MQRTCPYCKSSNVRRSRVSPLDATARPLLRSPYRCRECHEQFWVASQRAVTLAAFAIGTTLTVTAVVVGIVALVSD